MGTDQETAKQAVSKLEEALELAKYFQEENGKLRAEMETLISNARKLQEGLQAMLAQADRYAGKNALLERTLLEKDEWIRALETRIDTQTEMLVKAGVIKREVDVDGKEVATKEGSVIHLIGRARLQRDGKYRCLANVGGALCTVEVSLVRQS